MSVRPNFAIPFDTDDVDEGLKVKDANEEFGVDATNVEACSGCGRVSTLLPMSLLCPALSWLVGGNGDIEDGADPIGYPSQAVWR